MKLSESLENIGRPIAYYPSLARALRSTNAAIFLCQFFYWQDKATDERGVYKSMSDIEMETGLSEEEQRTARKKLKANGILLEIHVRLEHRIFYRIDIDTLDKFYDNYLNSLNHNQTGNPGFGKPGKAVSGNQESPLGETGNPDSAKSGFPTPLYKTEITSKITSETTTPARRPSSLSESEIAAQAQQLSEKLRNSPLRLVSLSLIKKLILDTAADHVERTAIWIIQQYGESHIRNPAGLLRDMVMKGMDKPLEAIHQDFERAREKDTKDYLERMRHERSKPKELGDDIKQFTASL